MNNIEKLDRRLFLRGLALTSAGLVVPRVVISILKPSPVVLYRDIDSIITCYVSDYLRFLGRLGYEKDKRFSKW